MSSSIIAKFITDDEIGSAALAIRDVLDSSKEVEVVAFSVLRILAVFLSKKIRCESTSKSSLDDIFKLADECCKALTPTWKCSHVSFMQYICHICCYLTKCEKVLHAKKLTLYFVNLKKQSCLKNMKMNQWNKDQKAVLNDSLSFFANNVFSNSNKVRNLDGDEDSLLSWWSFIMTLSKLNNYENIASTFQAAALLFTKLTNVSDIISAGSFIFKNYRSVVDCSTFISNCSGLETQKDLSLLVSMINAYFWTLYDNELNKIDCSDLLFILNRISTQSKNKKVSLQIELTVNFISLLYEDKCDKISNLTSKISDNISEALSYLNKDFINFISVFVFKLFKILAKNTEVMSECNENLFKLTVDVQLSYRKYLPGIQFNKKKLNTIINRIVCAVLFVVNSFVNTPQNLKNSFNDVWTTVNLFFNCEDFAETAINELNYGVYCCKSTIGVYMKAGFMYEAKELCRLLLIKIRAINFNSDPPQILKENVNLIMENFVETSSKCNFTFECLTYLLALTNDSNPLFKYDNKFSHWCKLKLLSSAVENVTVYDIINKDDERQLDESVANDLLKWPFSFVITLDYEDLLVDEIKSYLKFKELMKAAVISVYRIAVSVIESKKTLARILCCATEAVVQTCDSIANMNKFLLSLKNMIKIISSDKNNEMKTAEEKNLLLGDLHYYLARCVIYTQRKQAEKLVVDMQAFTGDDVSYVPIVDDPFDTTLVSSQFSFISYSTQENQMSHLKQACDFWTQASSAIKLTNDVTNPVIEGASYTMYNIKTCGYLNHLFKHFKFQVTFWQLLLELANSLKNAKYKIIAFSELCSLIPLDKNAVEGMELFVKTQDLQDEYYYYLFQIAICKNMLYNKKPEKCRETFNSIDESKLMKFKLIHIQYNIMSYWIKSGLEKSDKTKSRLLINQFEQCLDIQKKNKCSSFVEETINEGLLFDLSLTVSRMFCQGTDVRYARFYSSYTFKLSQERHLPIRLCEILILQAHTDELCVNVDQLALKLNSIETILELSLNNCGSNGNHSEECSCMRCNHVEYMILKIYAILVKASTYKIQQNTTGCISLIKDAQELISKVKKKYSGRFVTEITECDIFFSQMAVKMLTRWNKPEKALKYMEHGMKCIEKCHKPHDTDLSVIILASLLKLKLDIKLTPSNVTVLSTEPSVSELASCRTPQTDSLLKSPPPVAWKKYSPISGIPTHVIPNNKIKKLIFIKTPQTSNSTIDKDKCSAENNPSKIERSGISKRVVKKNYITPAKSNNIPTIEIEHCELINNSLSLDKKVNGEYLLKLPKSNLRGSNKQVDENFVTPHKSSITVFCDNDDDDYSKNVQSKRGTSKSKLKLNSHKTKRKSLASKNLFGSSNENHNSDSSDHLSSNGQGVIISSNLDDSELSVIDATTVEDTDVKSSKFQLTNSIFSPDIQNVQSKFSTLTITPVTPQVVKSSTSGFKKYAGKKKLESNTTGQLSFVPSDNKLINTDDQLPGLTPNVRLTRSTKKLLLSSKKK